MTTRYTSFAEGEFYHVYNRGVDKRVIFNVEKDFSHFQQLLYMTNTSKGINSRDIKKNEASIFDYDRGDQLVAIGAYCLMPNHFHILLTPLVERGISTFMNKLTTSYSMYFNKRNDRTGRLFEGSFKAKHADNDEYLKYLFAYIHLNPRKLFTQRTDVLLDISNYHYSSLADYVYNNREEGNILDYEKFPDYFVSSTKILEELNEWLGYNPSP
tara:strand:+ start:130 stop:768 length:639 start_codon:yes stop_codon:yes gene_type:complete